MSEYYAVVRSTDHLAHYGVKGMKWGVRKAIARGDQKKLDKHFRKAAKKLAKLQDIGLNSNKSYAKAAAYGAAAAGMGGLALGGGSAIRKVLSNRLDKKISDANAAITASRSLQKKITGQLHSPDTDLNAFTKVQKELAKDRVNNKRIIERSNAIKSKLGEYEEWANKPSVVPKINGNPTANVTYDANGMPSYMKFDKEKLTNGQMLRLGAGVAAVGLGAKAAQHLYRARNDAEYRERANQFKDAMDETFRGTKYEGQYVAPRKQRKKRR